MLVETAQERADFNRVAGLGQDFAQHAVFCGGNFDGDLVGLKLNEHVVFLHSIALGFQPLANRGLCDAFAKRRDCNVGHEMIRMRYYVSESQGETIRSSTGSGDKAVVTRAFCSALCFDRRPVAVAAEGARPA